ELESMPFAAACRRTASALKGWSITPPTLAQVVPNHQQLCRSWTDWPGCDTLGRVTPQDARARLGRGGHPLGGGGDARRAARQHRPADPPWAPRPAPRRRRAPGERAPTTRRPALTPRRDDAPAPEVRGHFRHPTKFVVSLGDGPGPTVPDVPRSS